MTTMPTALHETEQAYRQEAHLATARRDAVADSLDLRRAVRVAVIPRLRAALASKLDEPVHPLISGVVAPREDRTRITHDEVAGLASELLADDRGAAHKRIDALRRFGVSLETILIHLLAPAACHLRALWQDDLCGLAEMALAFCALQGLLRHHATEFRAEGGQPDTGLRALIASPLHRGIDVDLPVFGLLLTSEFFRRAGWDACSERDLTSGLFRDTVRGWFDLVEVLATSDTQLDEIAAGIKSIRRDSPNPGVSVIVCGQVFADHPEFVGMVGADTMATDPLSSLAQANTLVQAQLADRRPASERAGTAGQVRTLERILVQPRSSRRTTSASAAEAVQVMSCVQAQSFPTRPFLRKRLP